MIVQSLEMNKDPFRPMEEDEETLGLDILFAVNLLARYSAATMKMH
jgi:hypothetical protein